ncbi:MULTISPECIES: helix-turn-helix transcriptional regulator [Streptomyces]|uniref:Helix-turn-helix transcriptional regulator n=1 Tax=Streptomyces eurythermus TaxID=42237 RepID=A0ABW6Z0C2_9ACTN|nr:MULTISPECIES: helix-turn-helix transcriptional regulator [Streptomyces]QIS73444.1 helix-turn-helix domain-containing protein [Streptomyces sp. DSM 40868]
MTAIGERRTELSQFLRSRRARLTPADVGLTTYGPRRVPGLRREELAQLAGVSVEYYVRLEQGRNPHVSDGVLDAVGRALRLDADERAYLRGLARPDRARPDAAPAAEAVRPALRRLVDAQPGPAYVCGHLTQVLAWNPLAAAVFGDFGDLPPERRTFAHLVFLDERYRALLGDSLPAKAEATVAFLRMGVGRYPDDPALASLIGTLAMKSEEFAALWARQDVRDKGPGRHTLRHPLVGALALDFEVLHTSEPGQVLVSYLPAPGTGAEEALGLVGSWGADGARSGPAGWAADGA